MENQSYFFWLAEQAVDALLHIWPVTALLSLVVLGGGILAIRAKKIEGFRVVRWTLPQVLFPILILLAGAVWAGAEKYPQPSSWRSMLVLGIAILAAVVGVVATIRAKGARVLVGGISGFLLWCSFWCLFFAGMSIADDWI